MADRCYTAGLPVNTADFDVSEIAAAHAAGLHLHHNIGVSRTRRIDRVQPDIVHAMNVEHAHISVLAYRVRD